MEELEKGVTDDLDNPDEVSGSIQRAARKQAVRYRWEEESIDFDNPEEEDLHKVQYYQSIQFRNNEEAQHILNEYHNGKFLPWLSNHTIIPMNLTRRIQQSATSIPEPIFLFEEDDLWLTFEWEPGFPCTLRTAIVARPRTS